MRLSTNFDLFWLIFLLACGQHFWGLVPLSSKWLRYAVDFLILGISLKSISFSTRLNRLSAPVLMLVLSSWAQIFFAYLYHRQPMAQTFVASMNFLQISFFFYLVQKNYSQKIVEKAVIMLALIYCAIYAMQIYLYPVKIVNYTSVGEEIIHRGLYRILIEGSGFLTLAVLLTINRYLEKHAIMDLWLFLIFIVFFVMRGYRTLIVSLFIVVLFLLWRYIRWNTQLLRRVVIISLVVGALTQIPIFETAIDQMLEETREQTGMGKDYIRWREFNFFVFQFVDPPLKWITGMGLPAGETSDYALYIKSLEKNEGFYLADIGLFGLLVTGGLMVVFPIVIYSMLAVRTKTTSSLFYARGFFLYLLMSSLTTMELYRTGMFLAQAVALFLIYKNWNLNNQGIYYET